MGSTVYFAAWTDATGYELWKSDGTSGGTKPVDGHLPRPVTPGLPQSRSRIMGATRE